MRCNPSYWLLGLIPIALLSWIAVQFEHQGIENDLGRRSQEALLRQGFDWAVPNFSGRDGLITGRAGEDGEPTRAMQTVRNIWGVRVADDGSELLQLVDKFYWSANAKGDGQITLTGFVPSEEARAAVLGHARSLFPKGQIGDEMKLARGTLDRRAWVNGAQFALTQLASLKRGTAELNTLDLTMVGEAATAQSYAAVKSALAGKMPGGVRLALEKITAPVISPYVWSAVLSNGAATLSGFAPTDKDKADVAGRAAQLFAAAKVTDNTDVANGAPEGWARAAQVSLDQLARLKSGEAALKGKDLTFTGEAADEAAALAVRKTLRLDVPQNFKITEQIRYPKPELPTTAGYTMIISHDGTALEVSGQVPSEAARTALIDAVKARFPGRVVSDKTQIVPGAPEGWQQCIVAGLGALPKLQTGRTMLVDRKLSVTGSTDNYANYQSVPVDVKGAAGQTCETVADISFTGQMRTELSWRAVHETGGAVVLEGEVPDEPSRGRVLEVARTLFPGVSVTDRMKTIGASAEPWQSLATKGLQHLARLKRGEASLAGKELTLKGSADSEETASQVRTALAAGLPQGYAARDAITVLTENERAADQCQFLLREAASRGTLNFERAKADLTIDSTETLEDLAAIAKECRTFRIEIEGHTDAEGTDERNQRLSDRRARAVADFLIRKGVEANRLTTVGYGATRPIADNTSDAGRARNRRIEFTVKAE